MLQVIDKDRLLLRIHNPVFPDTRIGILVQLEEHVLGSGGRRQDLQGQIRRSFDIFCPDVILLTHDQQVRLYHGPVVPVQTDIAGGQINFKLALMPVHTLPEKNKQFPQDLLMNDRG